VQKKMASSAQLRMELPGQDQVFGARLLQEARPEDREPLQAALDYADGRMAEVAAARQAGCEPERLLREQLPEQMDAAAPFEHGSAAWCFYLLLTYKPWHSLYGEQPLLPSREMSAREACVQAHLMCAACGAPGSRNHKLKLHKCTKCKGASYCNKACQGAHWSEHKKTCAKSRKADEEDVAAEEPARPPLLNRVVEIFGLSGRPELNGKTGATFSYNAARGRYGVLVDGLGERVFIRSECLRPEKSQISAEAVERARKDPHVPYLRSPDGRSILRHCSNYECGAMAVVLGEESPKAAQKATASLLNMCAKCHEASYCSKSCQEAHWKFHKPLCKVSRIFHKLFKLWSQDKELNSVLRGYADEHAGGMDRRRAIHFRCPDAATAERMLDKKEMKKGVPVDIKFIPISDFRISMPAVQQQPGDHSIWQTALMQTEEYNPAAEMSIIVSVPMKNASDGVHMKPKIVPRL